MTDRHVAAVPGIQEERANGSDHSSATESGETPPLEPIAIVGMGMRLPGSVHNAAQYWDLLVNGKSGRCKVPESRYHVDAWYGPGKVDHVGTKYGYFLPELNLAHIDPSFWSLSQHEAASMDPQQRVFLEVVHEALETAGATGWRGAAVGVYVGTMGDDWSAMEVQDPQSLDPKRAEVYGDYILANRVSYEFDLRGPSLVVRTACSSSLVALHMACQDLRSGDCSAAVVGGVNLILSARETVVMTAQGVLSPTGSCKSFDAAADGYARGEGVSAIYIKKLADAVRDGDPIRAVIRSTCVGGDGKTMGLTTPSTEAHERLIRRGHRLAGITDLSKTAMIECHGTGTPTGDPLEAKAVANVWGDHGIYIGSVKPNLGHGEGASGLSSIMKMVLALENATIPPNINFHTPNPQIPWKEGRLSVPTEASPWPAGRLERVSVQSFGIGGSDAHVVLESAAACGVAPRTQRPSAGGAHAQLLVVSATHQESLKRLIQNTQAYLVSNPSKLRDLSYSLSNRREVYPHRAFCVADGQQLFEVSQTVKAGKNPGSVVWVFTGQGAQWPQMAKQLLDKEPLFRQRIDALDEILAKLPEPPPWSIKSAIQAPKHESRLHEAEFSQPCLAAIQIALTDLLRSWKVSPVAVVGHSSGETGAAYACGAVTAEDAILLAYHRGQVTPLLKAAHSGGMAAIGLGRRDVERYLLPGVIVGCENSPSSVTLSGEADELQQIMEDIRADHPDVLIRALRVECAYHSPHMQAVKAEYERRIPAVNAIKPLVPFYSSVTAKRHFDLSAPYWVQNFTSPVLFDGAVRAVLADVTSPVFVELGPHSALAGPARQILQSESRSAPYIPTLVRNADGLVSLLKTAGTLWLSGMSIDMAAVVPDGEVLTDLPAYPWHHEEHWRENRISRERRCRRFARHELLGDRVLETGDAAPAWRGMLRLEDVPWLRDHEVLGDVLMPAAGYVCMAGEAVRQLTGSSEYTLRQVSFLAPLLFADDAVEIVTSLTSLKTDAASNPVWYNFSVSSLRGDSWTEHITAQCRAGADREHPVPDVQALPRVVSAESFYNTWRKAGLNYGPRFRALSQVSTDVSEHRAVGVLQDDVAAEGDDCYAIHPGVIDSSFHVAMIAGCRGLERNFAAVSVPKSIESLYIRGAEGPIRVAGAVTDGSGAGSTSFVSAVSNGKVVIRLEGLKVGVLADGHELAGDDPYAGAVVEWKADVDFVPSSDFAGESGRADFLTLMGHKKPNMRILEICVGGDGITASILSTLEAPSGQRSYGSYTCAAATPDELVPLRERFQDKVGVNFAIFDVKGNPESQGLRGGDYDLLVATALSSTAADAEVLEHLRTLLHPQGRLVFKDVIDPIHDKETIQESWRRSLAHAGFDTSAAITVGPPRDSSTIVGLKSPSPVPGRLSILCRSQVHPLVSAATRVLEASGYTLELFTLGEDLPAGQHIVSLVDLESPFLRAATADQYYAFQKSLLSVRDSTLLWVTGAVQMHCTNPDYALVIGAARSLRREMGLNIVTLELESFSSAGWSAVLELLGAFGSRVAEEGVDPEVEYVFSRGRMRISRFLRVDVEEELKARDTPDAPLRLAVEKFGSLRGMHWRENEVAPLTEDMVEVETRAVGLNTWDLRGVHGEVEASSGGLASGFEGAGIVRRVGSGVEGLRPGDRVAFVAHGSISTWKTLPSTLCVAVPSHLSFEQAAIMPWACIAALYALVDLARVREGQSILLLGPWVGPKTVTAQIARFLGAEVVDVVEGGKEALELRKTSDLRYLEGQSAETGIRNADIVFTSHKGAKLQKAWDFVATFGTLVHIGAGRSLTREDTEELDLLEGSRTFAKLDLWELLARRPDTCSKLLKRGFEYVAKGTLQLQPLAERPVFEATQVEEAFRYLQRGQGATEAVLSIPEGLPAPLVRRTRQQTSFPPDKAYLLIGGLGGIGWAAARWLVEKGARHLVFFSRSAATSLDQHPEYLAELKAQGCTVQAVSGRVEEMEDVERAVKAAPRPIAGVLQAAMVLEDANFATLTHPQWQAVVAPKVQGTWNVHHALHRHQPTAPLAFLLLLSSLSGLGGMVGQANYAAANAFLDAFAQFRRARGLPASVVDLGVVDGVGVLARDPQRRHLLRAAELHTLAEAAVLDALELMASGARAAPGSEERRAAAVSSSGALAAGFAAAGQLAVGLDGSRGGVAGWGRDRRALRFRNAEGREGDEVDEKGRRKSAGLKGFLAECAADPARLEGEAAAGFLAGEIGATLHGFLMRGEDEKVDVGASLAGLGVDSLVSIELRNWLRQKMGVAFTVVEIRGAASLTALGVMAAARIAEKNKQS